MEEDQDKISGAVGSEVVQNFLQKYKVTSLCAHPGFIQLKALYFLHNSRDTFPNSTQGGRTQFVCSSCSPAQSHLIRLLQGFRIDLTCKQLTVDFVNQSVLQMSSHDVEGKRSDKTDFAEKLGAMNRRWQILQGLIGEKVTLRGN